VTDADLDGVIVDVQTSSQELNVTHPQRDRFTPTHTAVRQYQHQHAMII
jgi:hypothetical protein